MFHNKKSRRKVTQRGADRKPVAGVAWYSSNEWQRLREVAADPNRLEDTYQEWLAVVDHVWKKMEASGIALVKVPINASELAHWCRERNLPIDGKARAQYVVEVMKTGQFVLDPDGKE